MTNLDTVYSFLVSTPNPQLHFFHVELTVENPIPEMTFSMPVWAPGSYMVRNFSSNIHKFQVTTEKKPILFEKTGLHSWKIFSNQEKLTISYLVYANELSVRGIFLDTEFGFINSPSLFIYPENDLDNSVNVHFDLCNNFKFVYSSCPKNKENKYHAQNFDILFDSPFQISNQKSDKFQIYAKNEEILKLIYEPELHKELDVSTELVMHEIIIEGEISPEKRKRLIEDLKIIVNYQINCLFKFSPNNYYLFILILTENNYGGLEHSNSSANIFDIFKIYDKTEYNHLLELLSHEYFHLWNVKRLKPFALTKLNYNKEILFKELWIFEGITSYFDKYVLYLTQIITEEEFLREIKEDWLRINEFDGKNWMSLEDSSYYSWTKFYKNDPNYSNVGVSYYIKGAVVAFCLDIAIKNKECNHLLCENGLIDVLRKLYYTYYIKQNRGITQEEFFTALSETISNEQKNEFYSYVNSTKGISFHKYLNLVDLKFKESDSVIDLGFSYTFRNDKVIISFVQQQKNSGKADININDELIGINGFRVSRDNIELIKTSISKRKLIHLLLSRRGKIVQTKLSHNMQNQTKMIVHNS